MNHFSYYWDSDLSFHLTPKTRRGRNYVYPYKKTVLIRKVLLIPETMGFFVFEVAGRGALNPAHDSQQVFLWDLRENLILQWKYEVFVSFSSYLHYVVGSSTALFSDCMTIQSANFVYITAADWSALWQLIAIMQLLKIKPYYKTHKDLSLLRIISGERAENRWLFRSWCPQREGKEKEKYLFQTGELFIRKQHFQAFHGSVLNCIL